MQLAPVKLLQPAVIELRLCLIQTQQRPCGRKRSAHQAFSERQVLRAEKRAETGASTLREKRCDGLCAVEGHVLARVLVQREFYAEAQLPARRDHHRIPFDVGSAANADDEFDAAAGDAS